MFATNSPYGCIFWQGYQASPVEMSIQPLLLRTIMTNHVVRFEINIFMINKLLIKPMSYSMYNTVLYSSFVWRLYPTEKVV